MVNDITGQGTIYGLPHGNHLTFKTKEWEGVTNEEIVDVLIDRIVKLNSKAPCLENVQAIAFLSGVKHYLELRETRVKQELEVDHE